MISSTTLCVLAEVSQRLEGSRPGVVGQWLEVGGMEVAVDTSAELGASWEGVAGGCFHEF